MALNNMGLGFSLTADDAASLKLMRVAGSLGALKVAGDNAALSFDNVSGRMRDATTGRFVKRPEGMLNPAFISEVSGQLQSMGHKMQLVGAATVGALGFAAHSASEFEAGMAELGSIVDKTKFPMKDLDKIVKDMLGTYGGDSKTQIAAMYQAISAGATDGAKANGILKAANELAIAGATDQKTALLGLTKVLNNYNMEFSRSNEVADAFLTAIQGGSTTMGELGASIGDVAAGAKNAGFSMEELIGALGTGATLMGNTATAATGLKATIQSIAHPTSDAAAEAARLGIKFDAATIRAEGLQGMLKQITGSSKFTADSINKLFSSQEAANFITALSANNMSAYNDMMEQMGHKSGKARAAFEEMSKTMRQQLSVLKANLEMVAIEIGSALAPITGFLVSKLQLAVKWFLSLGSGVKKAIAFLGVAVGVIASVVGTLLTTGAALAGIILAAKAIAIGIGVAVAAFAILAAVMVPVIAGAALLYYVWTRDIGGLATRVRGFINDISLAFEALGQLFSDGGFSGKVQEDLSKAENKGIKQFAVTVFLWFNRIKNFVVSIGDAFESGMKTIEPTFNAISQALGRLWSRFQPVGESLSSAKDKFDAFGSAGTSVGGFLVKIVDAIAKAVLGAISFVDGFMETWDGLSYAWDAVVDIGRDIIGMIKDMVGSTNSAGASAQTTSDFFRGMGNALGVVANILVTVVGAGLRFVGAEVSFLTGIFGGVWQFFAGFFDFIGGAIAVFVKLFSGDFSGALKSAETVSMNFAISCLQAFGKVIAGAAGMVDSLAKIFKVDLGLKGKVNDATAGLAAKMATVAPAANGGAPAVAPASSSPTAAPAVAQAQGAASNTAALTAAVAAGNQKPVDVSVKSTLQVDGQVLAEAVQKGQHQSSGRGFAPTASPT